MQYVNEKSKKKKEEFYNSGTIEHYNKISIVKNQKGYETRIGRKVVKPKKNRPTRLWLRSNI